MAGYGVDTVVYRRCICCLVVMRPFTVIGGDAALQRAIGGKWRDMRESDENYVYYISLKIGLTDGS